MQRGGVVHQSCHHVVVHGVLHQHPGDGGAVLARVEKREFGDGCSTFLDVGVLENDRGSLPAEFQVRTLESFGSAGSHCDAGPD